MKIKSQDTAVTFTDTLTLDGAAVNLTGATVLFLIANESLAFSGAATVVNAASGTVRYLPGAGFPTTPGLYQQEWEVTFADASKLTFPSDRYNKVTILEDLN